MRVFYSIVVVEVIINDILMDVAVDGFFVGVVRVRSVEICDCSERVIGVLCEVS